MKYKNHIKIEQNGSILNFEFTSSSKFSNDIENIITSNPNISLELTTKHDGYLENTLFSTLKIKEGIIINQDEYEYQELFMRPNRPWGQRVPESIKNNKQFYLERAQLINHPEFQIYSDLDTASDQLKDDEEFVLELMKFNNRAYIYASSRVKAMPSILNEYIKHASKGDMSCLPKDNRITIAYERCKINPNYSERFGEPLKRRLNGMSIIDYVEKQNLHKSLKKNLTRKQAVTRTKI